MVDVRFNICNPINQSCPVQEGDDDGATLAAAFKVIVPGLGAIGTFSMAKMFVSSKPPTGDLPESASTPIVTKSKTEPAIKAQGSKDAARSGHENFRQSLAVLPGNKKAADGKPYREPVWVSFDVRDPNFDILPLDFINIIIEKNGEIVRYIDIANVPFAGLPQNVQREFYKKDWNRFILFDSALYYARAAKGVVIGETDGYWEMVLEMLKKEPDSYMRDRTIQEILKLFTDRPTLLIELVRLMDGTDNMRGDLLFTKKDRNRFVKKTLVYLKAAAESVRAQTIKELAGLSDKSDFEILDEVLKKAVDTERRDSPLRDIIEELTGVKDERDLSRKIAAILREGERSCRRSLKETAENMSRVEKIAGMVRKVRFKSREREKKL